MPSQSPQIWEKWGKSPLFLLISPISRSVVDGDGNDNETDNDDEEDTFDLFGGLELRQDWAGAGFLGFSACACHPYLYLPAHTVGSQPVFPSPSLVPCSMWPALYLIL